MISKNIADKFRIIKQSLSSTKRIATIYKSLHNPLKKKKKEKEKSY